MAAVVVAVVSVVAMAVVVLVSKVSLNFKRREGGDDRPRRSYDDKPRGDRTIIWW